MKRPFVHSALLVVNLFWYRPVFSHPADKKFTFTKEFALKAHGAQIHGLQCDDRFVYTSDADGIIAKSNYLEGQTVWRRQIVKVPATQRGVLSLALSHNQKLLLAGTSWGDLVVISPDTGVVLKTVTLPNAPALTALTIMSDLEIAIAGDKAGVLYLINITTGEFSVLGYHDWQILDLRMQGRDFLLAADLTSIKLWNLHTGDSVRTFPEKPSSVPAIWVQSLGYSRNLDYAVISSQSGIKLFNVMTSQIELEIKTPVDRPFQFSALIDDHSKIMATDAVGTVHVFDSLTGAPIAEQNFLSLTAAHRLEPLGDKGHFLMAGLRLDFLGLGWKQVAEVWKYQYPG